MTVELTKKQVIRILAQHDYKDVDTVTDALSECDLGNGRYGAELLKAFLGY